MLSRISGGQLGVLVCRAIIDECQVFSAARIEETTARIEDTSLRNADSTLRVEQALILHKVESHFNLQRLEVMMARVFVEEPFGQRVMTQTIEIISSVSRHRSFEYSATHLQFLQNPSHRTLEFQYLRKVTGNSLTTAEIPTIFWV